MMISRYVWIIAGLLLAATAVLTALKLLGAITWPWWVVLLPLFPIPLGGAILAGLFVWGVLCWMASGSH